MDMSATDKSGCEYIHGIRPVPPSNTSLHISNLAPFSTEPLLNRFPPKLRARLALKHRVFTRSLLATLFAGDVNQYACITTHPDIVPLVYSQHAVGTSRPFPTLTTLITSYPSTFQASRQRLSQNTSMSSPNSDSADIKVTDTRQRATSPALVEDTMIHAGPSQAIRAALVDQIEQYHAELEAQLAAVSSDTGRLEDKHATALASLIAQAKQIRVLEMQDRLILKSLAEDRTITSEAQTARLDNLKMFDILISESWSSHWGGHRVEFRAERTRSHDLEEFVMIMREYCATAEKARTITLDALYEADKPRREYLHAQASRISEKERSNTALTGKVEELEQAIKLRDAENTSLVARISEVERGNTTLTGKIVELEKAVEQRDAENISLVAEAKAAKAESDALRTQLSKLLDLFGLE